MPSFDLYSYQNLILITGSLIPIFTLFCFQLLFPSILKMVLILLKFFQYIISSSTNYTQTKYIKEIQNIAILTYTKI